MSGAITVGGALTINANATFATSNYQINIEGNWVNNGASFTAGSGTVIFDGTSAQSLGGTTSTTFSTLTINNPTTVTLGINTGVSADLALNSGVLANGGFAIALTGNITGTATESGTGTITMTTAGSTISGATLSNLTLNHPGVMATLTGNATITGVFTPQAGHLDIGANTLTLNGTVASMDNMDKNILGGCQPLIL